ncbi:hypothetical protein M5689_002290 [Euphorbia peplus]|nr:hypothetical protein M5689_002290 [Euphorbia peplus]
MEQWQHEKHNAGCLDSNLIVVLLFFRESLILDRLDNTDCNNISWEHNKSRTKRHRCFIMFAAPITVSRERIVTVASFETLKDCTLQHKMLLFSSLQDLSNTTLKR